MKEFILEMKLKIQSWFKETPNPSQENEEDNLSEGGMSSSTPGNTSEHGYITPPSSPSTGSMDVNIEDRLERQDRWSKRWKHTPVIPLSLVLFLFFIVALIPVLNHKVFYKEGIRSPKFLCSMNCPNRCKLSVVESIPEGLEYPEGSPKFPSTYEAWSELINRSTEEIFIASYYWSLRGSDIYPHPSAYQGEDIFQRLSTLSAKNINLNIVQNAPSKGMPGTDTEELGKKANAKVRSLHFDKLLGGGVLHTKFWIVDRKHFYVGSANMDWRSLTQVKELGVVVYDCPCMARDLMKIFDVYWALGEERATVPSRWPDKYSTIFDLETPVNTTFGKAFFSSSPPAFSPAGRTDDAFAIQEMIRTAEKFVYIAVMDYIPLIIYSKEVKFWPVLDNALRAAAINKRVNVRLLVSKWNHTRQSELKFLQSLTKISDTYKGVKVVVKLFTVPATPDQQKIPFARVNHNKYMVTDNAAYIGTSNWCGDYFTNTAGVGLNIKPDRKRSTLIVRNNLESVFLRDWNSPYAKYFLEDDISGY